MTPKNHPKPEGSEDTKTQLAIYPFSALIVLIAVVTALFPIDNFDIWWHLKTGEVIISNLSVPSTDIYSFTAQGNDWIAHEWLSEVIFYALYSLGGMNLLVIFKVLIAAMIALMLLYNIRRVGNINPIIFILIAAAICLGSFRLFIRPHLFTYLFLTFLTIKLSKHDDFLENKTGKWFLIPSMFMIWANMHSGFVIGLGIYWIISIGAFIKCFWGRQKNKIRMLNGLKNILAPVFLASMASLLNPSGVKAFTYPFILASEPVFRSAIAEMVSPFNIFSTEKLYWVLLIFVLSFAIYGILKNIRKKPAFSIVLVAVIISALSSIRNSYEAAIITASIMIVTLKEIPRRMLYIGMITALIFVSAFGIFTAKYIRDTRGFGTGVVTNLPYGAADFLKNIEFQGNIFSPLG